MTFRVKVNTATKPKFYYALNKESLDDLLNRLYETGETNAFVEARP